MDDTLVEKPSQDEEVAAAEMIQEKLGPPKRPSDLSLMVAASVVGRWAGTTPQNWPEVVDAAARYFELFMDGKYRGQVMGWIDTGPAVTRDGLERGGAEPDAG